MPMKDFDFFLVMKLVLLPTLANPGSRPKQLFGFRENEGNDQGLPHGLKATKRMNDLLPPLAPIASVYSAIGKATNTFSNWHRLNIQADGCASDRSGQSKDRAPSQPFGGDDYLCRKVQLSLTAQLPETDSVQEVR